MKPLDKYATVFDVSRYDHAGNATLRKKFGEPIEAWEFAIETRGSIVSKLHEGVAIDSWFFRESGQNDRGSDAKTKFLKWARSRGERASKMVRLRNPSTKRRKRTAQSRKSYIGRASQTTKRPPTKRLRTRRATMTLMRERGFTGAFPNPDSHDIWVQIQRAGKWHDVDGYASEAAARAMAEVFGKAGYTARVVRK
jgi:hypothetical protein